MVSGDGGDSRSMVIGVFIGCVRIDGIVLVMVVVMGCGLGSVGMPVWWQVVMVHGWHLFDVATVEKFQVWTDDFGGGLMRGVV